MEKWGAESGVELIDTLLPNQKKVSHGQAIAALILNGLGYVNKRLYLTPRFFEKKALSTLLGGDITAQDLNDDTLLRTLDACFAYGVTPLFAQVATKAVQRLGLTCKQLHLDSTSFHLHGAYETKHPDPSNPTQTDGADKNPPNTPQEEDASPHPYHRDPWLL